jgi:hypothetical protein
LIANAGSGANAGAIYFTTDKRVVALSAKDGTVIFSAFFPKELQSDRLAPDTIRIAKDTMTVAREIGVAVFSAKTGECSFFERVKGAEAFGSDIAMIRSQEAISAQIKRGKDRATVNGTFIAGNADAFRSLAVSNYRYASAQYSTIQRTGSSGEVSLAAANKAAARTQQQVAESTAQTLQTINAIQTATMGVINVTMEAFDEATGTVVKSINEDLERKMSNAASLQLLALNGKYYVRPYRTNNVGLAIINLEDRTRTDILIAPGSALINERQFITQIPLTLDADKGTLAVKVLLPGTLNWSYQTVRDQFGVIYSVNDVPRHSFARYDLASLTWKPVSNPIDQTAAVDTRTPQDLALLSAAAAGDVAGVKKALAAGASINAKDDQGRTALIHAARLPSMALYKVVVAAKPDPRIVDIEGLGAWDYVNYPPRMQVEDRTDSVNMVGPLSAYYKKWKNK